MKIFSKLVNAHLRKKVGTGYIGAFCCSYSISILALSEKYILSTNHYEVVEQQGHYIILFQKRSKLQPSEICLFFVDVTSYDV